MNICICLDTHILGKAWAWKHGNSYTRVHLWNVSEIFNFLDDFLSLGKSNFSCIFHMCKWIVLATILQDGHCWDNIPGRVIQGSERLTQLPEVTQLGIDGSFIWNPSSQVQNSELLLLLGVLWKGSGRQLIPVYWSSTLVFLINNCSTWGVDDFAMPTKAWPHPLWQSYPCSSSQARNRGNRKLNELPKGQSPGVNGYLLFPICLI